MKKIILVLACLIAIAAMPMTVMAHGHSGGYRPTGNTNYRTYGTCGVAGCTIAGAHQHNASYYGGRHHH